MKMKHPTATKIAPMTISAMSMESSTTPSKSLLLPRLLLREVSLLKTLDEGTRLLLSEESGIELLLKDDVFDMFFSGPSVGKHASWSSRNVSLEVVHWY